MTYILGQEKPSLDDLSHFGVKGMKWGHHKAEPTTGGSSSGGSAPSNRQLNKASRAKDKAANKAASAEFNKNFDKEIDNARSKLAGHNQQLRDAKAQYKVDKHKIGSREARKKLNETRDRVAIEREVASFAKSGKETRNAVLASVGVIAVSTIVRGGLAVAASR